MEENLMNSKIPGALYKQQELQRQRTVNTVLRAIAELKAEGYHIRIKDLMEHTGLSRSVFGKTHVRKLLIDNGIAEGKADIPKTEQLSGKLSKEQKLRVKLKGKDRQIKRISDENAALKSECELLRGRLFLLMQRQSAE
jgi:regulator of replication initiation timing